MTDDRTHGSGDAVDVVVIGGGVAGLAVAHDLARAGVGVVLLEAADELGGLLRRGRVAGIDIDLGAESFATRTDAVARLVADAGLPLDLVRPQPGGAALVLADPSGVGGVTRGPLPRRTVLGIPADPPLAEKWLALAAAGGHARAQRELATLLRQGAEGVEADPARATGLYRAAAEGGDPIAQDIWSRMLLEGQDGVAMDLAEARRWALAAAGAGIAPAMTRLGMFHHNAQGVERDVAEAARWWHSAAIRGDADGQAMLGAALHLGAGVAPDPLAAMVWLLRATRGGSTLARPFLPAVRASLTPAELSQALARSSEPLPLVTGGAG